MTELIVRM